MNKGSSSCRLNATVLKTANWKGKKSDVRNTWSDTAHSAQVQVYLFYSHLLSTCQKASLYCWLPSFTASPPHPLLLQPIHNCRPPIVVCQMPATDMLHHCAGVSGANCHLFFFPMLLIGRGSVKHRNTVRKKRYDQSCQPVVELIRPYTYWEPCNISIASDAATVH